MALEQHGDRVAFVDIRDDAWHRLNDLPADLMGSPLTAEEALQHAHLSDWNIRTIPAYVEVDGQRIAIPDAYGTVRDNPWEPGKVDALGVVGNQWKPMQNEDLTEFLNALVDESQGRIETAGSLRGGREVFVTMKLPDGMTIGNNDRHDLYLSALTAHDGKKATRFLAGATRIVCGNTQRMAEGTAVSSASVRHTRNASRYVSLAREKLELAFAGFAELESELERMLQTDQTEAEFQAMIDAVFYPDGELPEEGRGLTIKTNRDRTLQHLWADADTQADVRGTRYAGYQAVVEYLDHFAPVNGSGGSSEKAALLRAERAILKPQVERSLAFDLARVPA